MATGTPSDGRLSKYRAEIRMKMLMNAKRNRKYPNVSIDDQVRLFRKKDRFDKEKHGIWSRDLHTVEDIVEHDGQQLYKIRGYNKPFVRSEILLIETVLIRIFSTVQFHVEIILRLYPQS